MILSIDPGSRHLALCILQTKTKIVLWDVLSVRPTNNQHTTAKDVSNTLNSVLPSQIRANITRVVIERQPPRNLEMLQMQHWLEMWCAIHCDKADIVLMNAQSRYKKLAALTAWADALAALDHLKDSYRKRKLLAVDVTMRILQSTPHMEEKMTWFQGQTKQDDLADAFLQATTCPLL